ncbi:MAG: iron ABC transporter permease [Dehalococcoidia bacterium]|nr:iron ABC transporter permease [Dehalococcoidia bacterium]
MSGAIFQGLVRNPLVSPDIIGINAGATLAAVWWIVTGQPPSLLPLAAFGGATGTAVAIYAFTWRNGISGNRLILVGIGVAAILTAGTTFLMVRYPIEQVSSAVHWSSGTVYGSNWEDVRVLAAALVVLAPLAAILMWPLRVLQFGDDMASGLGMNVEVTRLGLLLTGCALASVAVAIAGPVGFVALMVPHVARMLAGPITGGVILFAALLGSMLVLGADMVAQHALPVSLPVGVITAAVGAPYFLFLLYRSNVRL